MPKYTIEGVLEHLYRSSNQMRLTLTLITQKDRIRTWTPWRKQLRITAS